MGTPHEVITDQRRYLVITDTHLFFRVLAWGRVIGPTGAALVRKLDVRTDLRNAFVRSFDDGSWCVAGDPSRSFEDLTVVNTFVVELSVAGYRSQSVTVTVPVNPVWPIVAGTQGLRPLPVRLQGRVIAKTTGLPVAGGRVITVDPPVGPPPVDRPFLLRSCLKQNHTAAASVRGVTLTPVALPPPARVLDKEVARGSTVIVANNRSGLAAPQVIQFRDDRSGEYARIASVSPVPANMSLPGEVMLESALGRSFPATTPLSVFTTGAGIGPARAVTQPADSGIGILLIADYPSGDVIRITEAGQFDEFHNPGALTDADGYYALDRVGDVVQMHLGVEATGFASPPKPELWVVNYDQAVNVMDFRLV
jgi:hypothetical protein